MTFTIGQAVEWHKTINHDGNVHIIHAVIRKIGKTRITVELEDGTRLVSVMPHNLKPLRHVDTST
jgi:hypothetical protein